MPSKTMKCFEFSKVSAILAFEEYRKKLNTLLICLILMEKAFSFGDGRLPVFLYNHILETINVIKTQSFIETFREK
jgi:hypothetical protein